MAMASFTPPATVPAPKVGGNTLEILQSLGYTQEQIDAMLASGAAVGGENG